MRKINLIVVHCTATPEGRDVTVADIDRMHRARGWKKIGYHYVVYRDGSVHEGRPVNEVGAHVYGHNANSIGVVYVGGVAKDGKTAKDTRTTGPAQSPHRPAAEAQEAVPRSPYLRPPRPLARLEPRRKDRTCGVGEGLPML